MMDATTKPIKEPETAPTTIFTGIYHLQSTRENVKSRKEEYYHSKVTAEAKSYCHGIDKHLRQDRIVSKMKLDQF
jgi:hypothetical protein